MRVFVLRWPQKIETQTLTSVLSRSTGRGGKTRSDAFQQSSICARQHTTDCPVQCITRRCRLSGLAFRLRSLILAIAILPAMPLRIERVWWGPQSQQADHQLRIFAARCGLLHPARRTGLAIAGLNSLAPHWPTLLSLLHFAVLEAYLPFIDRPAVALYVMSGGVRITGDPAGKPALPTPSSCFWARSWPTSSARPAPPC